MWTETYRIGPLCVKHESGPEGVQRVCVANLPSLGNGLQKGSRLWRWSPALPSKSAAPFRLRLSGLPRPESLADALFRVSLVQLFTLHVIDHPSRLVVGNNCSARRRNLRERRQPKYEDPSPDVGRRIACDSRRKAEETPERPWIRPYLSWSGFS